MGGWDGLGVEIGWDVCVGWEQEEIELDWYLLWVEQSLFPISSESEAGVRG